ncbi:chlorophyll synthesis pathway protein BchC [Bradyrhizobium guangzhouense]|uniref:Chlorophyll synthesis pathway protein BchC n=1 Tax=Bradyrhizobium guangzhouense TaxID=1325095 RepID=A0AAE5WWT0_9BRAD|nr:chlorophyll synthesis pathway protein BchC [Bradyrhizobium guangzhouense]QAU44360.1 chlorophyll synthesis pathway protein BchC [Bradyrhizobium guangzhouense]RXH10069.1 chlorophyll synthesis pathway protein BchC [Bradyrhizobium guangzhouense]
MDALAVVLENPRQLALQRLALAEASGGDIVVEIEWTAISTGTERLLFEGRMPAFPGMGYPLVPGYEAVGRVQSCGGDSGFRKGERVFVPGAAGCFGEVRSLFGAAASHLVVPAKRVVACDEALGEQGALLALAATAYHALRGGDKPDCIVGHGVLGRLLARLTIALGAAPPVVWEHDGNRAKGGLGYDVIDPASNMRRDYRVICDVSGDASLLDDLIGHLAPGGEIVLAGFYSAPLSFVFPPAFMREARIRVAAEWRHDDLVAVRDLVDSGKLSLDGLISHRAKATAADEAYRTAFHDPSCLKMALDWRACV